MFDFLRLLRSRRILTPGVGDHVPVEGPLTVRTLRLGDGGAYAMLEFDGWTGETADVAAITTALERTGAAQDLVVVGPTVSGRVRAGASLVPQLLIELHDHGVVVASAEVARPTLDDVFLTLTGRSLREGPDDSGGSPPDDAGDPGSGSSDSIHAMQEATS